MALRRQQFPAPDTKQAIRSSGLTEFVRFAPLIYGFAFALALVSAKASLALNLGLALFFALPHER